MTTKAHSAIEHDDELPDMNGEDVYSAVEYLGLGGEQDSQ